MIRALLVLGIPYVEACQIPLHVAMALLSDERLENTYPTQSQSRSSPIAPQQPTASRSTGTTFIASRRKPLKPLTDTAG